MPTRSPRKPRRWPRRARRAVDEKNPTNKRVFEMSKCIQRLLALCFVITTSIARAGDVPQTLDQAFVALDHQLSWQQRELFKSEPESKAVANAHMGLGMYIRNTWFRAGHSQLANQFRVLGARSLDDASSIVLTSYWRRLNGRPLDVAGQVARYANWWKEQMKLKDKAMASGKNSCATPSFHCP